MIAKISSTENLGGALGYNFKKVEKEEAFFLPKACIKTKRELIRWQRCLPIWRL
jgi:hypothetical protein